MTEHVKYQYYTKCNIGLLQCNKLSIYAAPDKNNFLTCHHMCPYCVVTDTLFAFDCIIAMNIAFYF